MLNSALYFIVNALVAFIPTSQSASERHFADIYRLSYSFPSLRFANPSFMAASVILEIQSLLNGFLHLLYSYIYLKISSPSRPLSVAHIMLSVSLAFISFLSVSNCFLLPLTAFSFIFSGIIGRLPAVHLFRLLS